VPSASGVFTWSIAIVPPTRTASLEEFMGVVVLGVLKARGPCGPRRPYSSKPAAFGKALDPRSGGLRSARAHILETPRPARPPTVRIPPLPGRFPPPPLDKLAAKSDGHPKILPPLNASLEGKGSVSNAFQAGSQKVWQNHLQLRIHPRIAPLQAPA
jgi:hypothetical protein